MAKSSTISGVVFIILAVLFTFMTLSDGGYSGNPVFEGKYADPEGAVFGKEYWIYPTSSLPYGEQMFLDAFSSEDLTHWEKHPKIITYKDIGWYKAIFFIREDK